MQVGLCNLLPTAKGFSRESFATSLVHELEEVNAGTRTWTEVCFIQFLSVGASVVGSVAKVSPTIFLLASAGAKHQRRSVTADGPVLDDDGLPRRKVAPRLTNEKALDIRI